MNIIIVRLDMEAIVKLPEGVNFNKVGELSKESRSRAIEAAIAAIPQRIEIFLDGDGEAPVSVFFDADEAFCVDEVWAEGE